MATNKVRKKDILNTKFTKWSKKHSSLIRKAIRAEGKLEKLKISIKRHEDRLQS